MGVVSAIFSTLCFFISKRKVLLYVNTVSKSEADCAGIQLIYSEIQNLSRPYCTGAAKVQCISNDCEWALNPLLCTRGATVWHCTAACLSALVSPGCRLADGFKPQAFLISGNCAKHRASVFTELSNLEKPREDLWRFKTQFSLLSSKNEYLDDST